MADDAKTPKTDKEHKQTLTNRPPAKPGPRDGWGKPPSSTGEGNTSGGQAGVDANDPTKKPTP